MVAVSDYWSTIPLFILFREAIEASIIVSVLISFTRRKNAGFLEKQVWWGVGLGVVVSILFGIIFIVIYYKAAQNLFQGPNQMIFKGAVSWMACLMITYLAFTMLQFFGWEDKWKRKLDIIGAKQLKQAEEQAAASGKPVCKAGEASLAVELVELESVQEPEIPKERWMTKYAFFIAIFLTVVREGLESVVFLAGVGNSLTTRKFFSSSFVYSILIFLATFFSLCNPPPWVCWNPLWAQHRLHPVLHWQGSQRHQMAPHRNVTDALLHCCWPMRAGGWVAAQGRSLWDILHWTPHGSCSRRSSVWRWR